jgi:hypothetical protein
MSRHDDHVPKRPVLLICEACGEFDQTTIALRPFYEPDDSMVCAGDANICDECYKWRPADDVTEAILRRRDKLNAL